MQCCTQMSHPGRIFQSFQTFAGLLQHWRKLVYVLCHKAKKSQTCEEFCEIQTCSLRRGRKIHWMPADIAEIVVAKAGSTRTFWADSWNRKHNKTGFCTASPRKKKEEENAGSSRAGGASDSVPCRGRYCAGAARGRRARLPRCVCSSWVTLS